MNTNCFKEFHVRGNSVVAGLAKKGAPKRGSANQFEATSNDELRQDDLKEIQANLGYPPAGYDFYGLKVHEFKGLYKYFWMCGISCD